MASEKDKRVAALRGAIPTVPATGKQLKLLSKELICALKGTALEHLTEEILHQHVPRKLKTGRDFSKDNANYLFGVADYLDSLLSDDLSDASLETYNWFQI